MVSDDVCAEVRWRLDVWTPQESDGGSRKDGPTG